MCLVTYENTKHEPREKQKQKQKRFNTTMCVCIVFVFPADAIHFPARFAENVGGDAASITSEYSITLIENYNY